jgi:hypothetical protein
MSRRQGEAVHPQRPRLDRQVRQGHRQGPVRARPPGPHHRRRAGGRERRRRLGLLRPAGRPRRRAHRPASSTPSTCCTRRHDLPARPAADRKAALAALLGDGRTLALQRPFEERRDRLRHACRLSLEGVVSKQAMRPYRSGRGRRLDQVQMLRAAGIRGGGFVPSTTSGKAIGSLLLGVHDKGR